MSRKFLPALLLVVAAFHAHGQTFTVTPGGNSSYDTCEGMLPTQERMDVCAGQRQAKWQAQAEAQARNQHIEQYAQQALLEAQQQHWIDAGTIARGYASGFTSLQIVVRVQGLKDEDAAFIARHPGEKHQCAWNDGIAHWECFKSN